MSVFELLQIWTWAVWILGATGREYLESRRSRLRYGLGWFGCWATQGDCAASHGQSAWRSASGCSGMDLGGFVVGNLREECETSRTEYDESRPSLLGDGQWYCVIDSSGGTSNESPE